MAENPFAKFAPTADPANPFAKFASAPPKEEGTSVVQDVANIAVPSAIRGTLGLLTTPGSMEELAGKGLDWAVHKAAPEAAASLDKKRAEMAAQPKGWLDSVKGVTGAWRNLFPTYGDALKKVEENVTGKLPEAKTGVGRAVQTGLEVAPSLMTGGVLRAIPKAIGAGAASEGLGQAAAAGKKYLPESWQPVAEPVARGVGAVAGTFTPSGLRRAVTPLPMSDNQLAAVNALRAEAPNFPMSAGQATQRPGLMALEARTPRMQGMGEAQERAFTEAAMRQAGINGDFTALPQGAAVGDAIGNIRRGGNMANAQYAPFLQSALNERRQLQRTAGRGRTPQMDEAIQQIQFGAMNNGQPVMSMPGGRYDYMRQELERLANAAGNPQERLAIGRVRTAMDDAFRAGLPADTAENLANLERQYANYNVLANIRPEAGRATITPQEVKSAVGHSWGNKAANEGRGTLAPLADNAAAVMTPHPIPNTTPPAWFDLATTLGTGLVHGGASHLAGQNGLGTAGLALSGSTLGHFLAPSIYSAGAGIGSRAVSNPLMQRYLANQRWRPGEASTADAATIARILASPTQQPVLPAPGP